MKKLILGLLVIVAAAATATLLYADHIAQRAVESGSSRAFGTPVSVGGVRLGLMDASFNMSGYEVANPGEFESPYLFGIGGAELAVGYDGLGRQRIEAERLKIHGVVLNLEMSGKGTNFGPVLRHVRELSRQEGDAESRGPRFVIRRLELSGIRANINLPGVKRTVEVPPVALDDVGGEDGVWMSQLAAIVLETVLDRAARGSDMPPQLSGLIADGLSGLPSRLAEEARRKVEEALDKEAGGLLDRVGEAVTGGDGEGN